MGATRDGFFISPLLILHFSVEKGPFLVANGVQYTLSVKRGLFFCELRTTHLYKGLAFIVRTTNTYALTLWRHSTLKYPPQLPLPLFTPSSHYGARRWASKGWPRIRKWWDFASKPLILQNAYHNDGNPIAISKRAKLKHSKEARFLRRKECLSKFIDMPLDVLGEVRDQNNPVFVKNSEKKALYRF